MPRVKMKVKTPLSTYLPAAIRQAVADVLALHRTGRYRIEMSDWHRPEKTDSGKRVCDVCFAGAAIARRTSVKANEYHSPCIDGGLCEIMTPQQRKTLEALNYIRSGELSEAMETAGFKVVSNPTPEPDLRFDFLMFNPRNPRRWAKRILRIADWLERNEAKPAEAAA